jgi:DNA-binding winged helix-turn-helix (wHTH) protein/tetratricopeptide (TPR) repeat protein
MSRQAKLLYEFGPFRLIPDESLLLRDGQPVALSPKGFEVLVALVRRGGSLVGKEELLKEVWPDAFVEEANLSRQVYALRRALGEDEEGRPYIETVPKRGYRFTTNVREVGNGAGGMTIGAVGAPGTIETVETVTRTHIVAEEEISLVDDEDPPRVLPQAVLALPTPSIQGSRKTSRLVLFATITALAVGIAVASYFYFRRPPALTDRDVILLAEFENRTGDDVFDGTLKQALAVQLEQSPFLSIFSDERVRETLRYMGRSPDERVTKEMAREVCQRQGIKALLTGTIVSLGGHYVMTLEAMHAQTGNVIARGQVEAAGKEQVLKVLGEAASRLREKLGESLPSIQKFDAPLEQATTSSLEALKAFSLAREQHSQGKYLEAIPLYKRAIELDPNFALAYNRLAAAYSASRQTALAAESSRLAFELRERISEREKLYISASYYATVTREVEKTAEVYELLTQAYPRDSSAQHNLASSYLNIGQYEKAVAPAREAIRLNPTFAPAYTTLASSLIGQSRYDEAQEVLDQAVAQKTDALSAHTLLHTLALIRGDSAGMQRQVDWARGRSDEYLTLEWQAQVADLAGQRRTARELYGRAIELAKGRGLVEYASGLFAHNALRYALLGDCVKVKGEVASAFATMRSSRGALYTAADALMLCGETGEAQPLVEELERQYPKDTAMIQVRLPTIRAVVEINRGNPEQAIQLLQTASRYELAPGLHYGPVYARGLAYLRASDGARAMAEFQKIIDNRGVDALQIRHPLSRLGLARAVALTGDTARSRKAYEDFFALWKDADSDIPILLEAKREYERLR